MYNRLAQCLYGVVDVDPVGAMVIRSTMNVFPSEYIDRGVPAAMLAKREMLNSSGSDLGMSDQGSAENKEKG